jgi:hypothetical protein
LPRLALLRKELSKETFNEQQERIEKEIKELKTQIIEVETNDLEITSLLNFGELLFKNPLELWETASIEQKRRIQSYFYPEGLIFDGKAVGTPSTTAKTFIDGVMKKNKISRWCMVARRGIEPLLPA